MTAGPRGSVRRVHDELELRAAGAEDVPFLWTMLAFAASMAGGEEDVRRARADPALRDYVEGFGRPGDVGVVARLAGEPVGAAWVRLAPAGERSSSKVWTEEVPELAIAAIPGMRGRGLGTRLLDGLIAAVRGRHASVALSVREGSAAIRLYARAGFVVERRITNRVGTPSIVMTLRL